MTGGHYSPVMDRSATGFLNLLVCISVFICSSTFLLKVIEEKI